MATPIQNIHAPERHPAPLIDACMMGWVRGVVNPQGGLVAFEGEDMVPQIRQVDVEASDGPGLLTQLDASHGWPHAALELPGLPSLDLWQLVRPHVAWTCRDDSVAFKPEEHKKELLAPDLLGMPLLDLFRYAGGLILSARKMLLPYSHRAVPVIVEGGRHLFARCIREAARSLGMPVWAIENTWVPGFALMSPSGIAVNCFGHEYSWMEDELLGLEDQQQLLSWINVKLSASASVSNARRYPWMYPKPSTEEPEIEALDYMYEKGRLCLLVLGQVPYDASVIADNPQGMSMEGLTLSAARHCIERNDAGLTVIYRPHPMEEPSKIDGLLSRERVIKLLKEEFTIPAGKSARVLISDPAEISLAMQLAAHHGPVVTINSQAGLQASLWHPTTTAGRAFYDILGLTSSGITQLSSADYRDRIRPMNRWARYVSFLLRRCYADKEKLRTPEGFLRALSHRAQAKVPPWSKSFLPPWRSA